MASSRVSIAFALVNNLLGWLVGWLVGSELKALL
jgi:hypothetical protein